MTIKVTLHCTNPVVIYPCLMQHKENGTVYLMRGSITGVAITGVGLGDVCNALDTRHLKVYHGCITLAQE